VTTAVSALREAGVNRLYKKIDSTLRGQIRAELDAVLAAWSADAVAVICPSFPALRRTVVNGRLLVDGVPADKTSLRNDPLTPVTESHIPTLVQASYIKPSAQETAAQLAERLRKSGPKVVVDAQDEAGMRKIAEAVSLLGPEAVPIGSAGMARHLAEIWTPSPSFVVAIVTSHHELARRQARSLAETGARYYSPNEDDILEDEKWTAWSSAVVDDPEPRTVLLLTAPAAGASPSPSTAEVIPKRFAALAARLFALGRADGFVVTGGDGTRALLDALGANGVQLIGEVMAGIPIGKLVGGTADGAPIVTKAGGFGTPDALVQAARAVAKRRTL